MQLDKAPPAVVRIRQQLPGCSAVYLAMPPTDDTGLVTTSPARSLGISFSAHRAAVVQRPSGRIEERDLAPSAGGMTSGDTVKYLLVREPTECVEFAPEAQLLREVAEELRAPSAVELAELADLRDAGLQAAALRFRMHARGVRPLDALEADALVRGLLEGIIVRHLGGRPPRDRPVGLDSRRLVRVAEHVEANLGGDLTLSTLAEVAALSPFHFARQFWRATGLSPHAYVTARRVEVARRALAEGRPVAAAAAASGYRNGHAFRAAFARAYGGLPGEPRMGGRLR